jgi:predicted RND superfamily exporter protein
VDTAHQLVPDLMRGTLLMLLLVSIAIGVALRSARYAIAAVLPNLLAPLIVFACASMLNWPLDVSAIAVAAVAIGLATDDSFHLLFAVAEEDGNVGRGLQRVGRALLVSTMILAMGLFCLLASRFLPTARFGALAASAAPVAHAADHNQLPPPRLLLSRR